MPRRLRPGDRPGHDEHEGPADRRRRRACWPARRGRCACRFPQPGWVEQDADDALAQRRRGASSACLARRRHPTVAADRRHQPARVGRRLGPRAPAGRSARASSGSAAARAPFCADLRARGLEPLVQQKTGLDDRSAVLGEQDPLAARSHRPTGSARAANGELCVGTVDSWLLWNLTGGAVHACDVTNASRTQLLNLRRAGLGRRAARHLRDPAAALPRDRPSSGVFGDDRAGGRLPGGVPDRQPDRRLARRALRPRGVRAGRGEGHLRHRLVADDACSTRRCSRARGLSTTVAWALPDRASYALEGNITVTGGAVEWLGQLLGLADPAQAVAELAATVRRHAAASTSCRRSPGLGAPHWDADARGLICGLTRGTTAAHVARATLESIAYQVRDVFDAMRADTGAALAGAARRRRREPQRRADAVPGRHPRLPGRPQPLGRSLGAAARPGSPASPPASGASLDDAAAAAARRSIGSSRGWPTPSATRLYDGWREAVARARSHRASRPTERHRGDPAMARIDELRLLAKVARLYHAAGPPADGDHRAAQRPPVHGVAAAEARREGRHRPHHGQRAVRRAPGARGDAAVGLRPPRGHRRGLDRGRGADRPRPRRGGRLLPRDDAAADGGRRDLVVERRAAGDGRGDASDARGRAARRSSRSSEGWAIRAPRRTPRT